MAMKYPVSLGGFKTHIRIENLSKNKQCWLLEQDVFNKDFISLAYTGVLLSP